jgi:LuxR family transcriptional regulator, maltose regulon positive regulatory protein
MMQKADTLIRTKLRQPFTRLELVPRPRLQERIAVGLCGPLTLVTAPAGFGKTTLVGSCTEGCGMLVAWLSLDKEDNQPGRFLHYLVAAMQEADRTIGSEATQLITAAQQASPEAVLTSLVNDLDTAGKEFVLVLDDYQFISSQAVYEAVVFLLEHCPRTFHLVIATRSDPPLPLARLRARGQAVELRAADLRFTASEAAQFLNDVMCLHLDAGAVAVLEERTEGWIAGLQMAALSMRDRKDAFGFIEGFSGTNRYILDYLLEEVLASQPPEIQRFLLFTSILERLAAPLCDAILVNAEEFPQTREDRSTDLETLLISQSASTLVYLERANLFLVPLDDERQWYRYHHLFADLLKARLHQSQPDLASLLHIRASAWLEQNGLIPEAIQHLLTVHEFGRAASLIERYGPGRWAESDPSVIQMAEGLPHEIILVQPKIGLYYAWYLIILGLIEKALPLLNDLGRHLAGADPNSGQQWMQTFIGLALAFLGQRKRPGFDTLPDVQVLDEIPASEPILRDTAEVLYAMTLGRRGEIDRAAEVAVRCMQRVETPHGIGTLTIPAAVSFLARIYLVQGRLHAAASLSHVYLDPIKERGLRFIYSAGSMNIVLGDVLYEQNYLAEAEKQIRDGLKANEPWVDIMNDAFALLALTRLLLAKRDFSGAMQFVERFETRLHEPLRPHEFEEDFRTLRIRVQLASGDLQSASLWADQIHLNQDYHLHPERYRLTLAHIRLAQGRYSDMENLLSGKSPLLTTGNRITRQIESNLLRAAAAAGQDRQSRLPEALGLIEACLALAEPEGYVRVFLDVGEPVRDLLFAYLKSPASGHKLYAQKLLDAFPPSGAASISGPQASGLIEPLTGRELEVLQLMALGRTNQQIARQLFVAPGTVKAHAASIFRKLDVSNRTEAVARARKLGILP